MDPEEFIRWLGFWFYMGFWVGISNRRKWWSTAEPEIYGGAPFRLNKFMSSNRFGVILGCISYKDKNYVGYYDGFFHMRK